MRWAPFDPLEVKFRSLSETGRRVQGRPVLQVYNPAIKSNSIRGFMSLIVSRATVHLGAQFNLEIFYGNPRVSNEVLILIYILTIIKD